MSLLRMPPTNACQRGDTLIEALVTIIILAFGLLGIAGLLAKNLALSNNAYTRTAVAEKIYALADRMRVNAAGVTAGNYNSYTSPTTAPTTCAATPIASADLCLWSQDLAASLPGGWGAVTVVKPATTATTTTSTGLFTILVCWSDPKSTTSSADPSCPTASTNQSYSLTVREP